MTPPVNSLIMPGMREKPRGANEGIPPHSPEQHAASNPAEIAHRSPRGSGPSVKVTVRLKRDLLVEATAEARRLGLALASYISSAVAVRVRDHNAALTAVAIRQLREQLESLKADVPPWRSTASLQDNGHNGGKFIAFTAAIDALDETVRRFKL